jgi:YidC/Oxa1 family membrane protein insertase
MDKTGIIVVSLCAALLVFWFYEQQQAAVRWQQQQQQQQQFAATNVVAAAQSQMTATIPSPASSAPVILLDTNAPEQTVVLTNGRPRHDWTRYTFTSRGGGLKLVELLDYPETVSARWTQTKTASDTVASLNTRAAVPVLAVLGDSNLVGDGVFALSKTDDGVRAEKLLPDGLRLVKEFHLGSNFLVNASVRFENTSDKPLALPAQEWVVGTATPMDVDDTSFSIYGGAMWFDGVKYVETGTSYFNTNTVGLFGLVHRTPTSEYRAGKSNVVWAAAHNQFFALLAGAGSRRARGEFAGVSKRRAGARHAGAAGNPDRAGLSGANLDGQFSGRAADDFVRRAEGIPDAGARRRTISKPRRSGDEFRHGLHEFLGRRNIFCETAALGDELAA